MYVVKLNKNLSFKTASKLIGEKIKDLVDAIVCAAELSDCNAFFTVGGSYFSGHYMITVNAIDNKNYNCRIYFYTTYHFLNGAKFSDNFVQRIEQGEENVHKVLEKALRFLADDGKYVDFSS